MLGVCVLFVPSAVGVVTAGWAICSISLGWFLRLQFQFFCD